MNKLLIIIYAHKVYLITMDAWLDETQVAFEEYSDQSLHSGELYSYRFIINLGQHLLIKSLAVTITTV